MVAELGIVVALGACVVGCQTSTLTATGWDALREARSGRPAPPTPDERAALEPPPTVRAASPAPERIVPSSPTILGPGAVLTWVVESGGEDPPFSGKDVVRDDGQINLGPYGSVSVVGLTPQQASTAMARYQSRWVRTPRVRLSVSVRRAPDTRSVYVPVQPTITQETRLAPRPATLPAGMAAAYPRVQPVGHSVGSPAEQDRGPQLTGEGSGVAMTIAATQGQTPTSYDVNVEAEPPAGKVKAAPAEEKVEEAPAPNRVVATPAIGGLPPPHPIPDVPTELKKVTLPPYVIEPPDILIVEAVKALPDQDIRGQHAVRPDGTIGLGIYGSIYVAGKTLDQAREAIYQHLKPRLSKLQVEDVYVDVLAYNSKVYYVITDGGGFGEQVYRIPVTGSETVLDALGQVNGLPPVASKHHIWVARRGQSDHDMHQVLQVDWIGITQHGDTSTNYQVMPGDRIYVKANKLVTVDTFVARVLSPIERILGATLLGSSVVNSIKGRGASGSGSGIGR
jgi:polysaccharide export outer membrane protein